MPATGLQHLPASRELSGSVVQPGGGPSQGPPCLGVQAQWRNDSSRAPSSKASPHAMLMTAKCLSPSLHRASCETSEPSMLWIRKVLVSGELFSTACTIGRCHWQIVIVYMLQKMQFCLHLLYVGISRRYKRLSRIATLHHFKEFEVTEVLVPSIKQCFVACVLCQMNPSVHLAKCKTCFAEVRTCSSAHAVQHMLSPH